MKEKLAPFPGWMVMILVDNVDGTMFPCSIATPTKTCKVNACTLRNEVGFPLQGANFLSNEIAEKYISQV